MDNQKDLTEVSRPGTSYARYAYRLETKRIHETDFPYNAVDALDKPSKVVSFAGSIQNSDIEKFIVLYLDAKKRLICIQITTGTINKANVWPREVLKHALLSGAVSIILVHNHPSGDPTSSSEDKNLTQLIVEACKPLDITVNDHIIIGSEGKYLSFAEETNGNHSLHNAFYGA